MKQLVVLVSLIFLAGIADTLAQSNNLERFGINSKKGKVPNGLQIGTKAPDFTADTYDGKTIKLSHIAKNSPVVLFFYRGQWCPVCNKYLKRYADSLSLLISRGANVVAVTPETTTNIKKTKTKTGIDVHVVPDKKEIIMNKYNVAFRVTRDYQNMIRKNLSVDIAANNNQIEAVLPVPATYIIDKNRRIVARQFDIDYNNRASVNWMLNKLDNN
jgi:peroxiredoxin